MTAREAAPEPARATRTAAPAELTSTTRLPTQIPQPQVRPHRRVPTRDVEPHSRRTLTRFLYAATPPIGMT